MTNTFITDLQDYMAANIDGLTINTNFFISGFSGDTPDQICLMETGSPEADIDLPLTQPTIQVLCKNQSYAAGRALMWQIYSLLHQKVEIEMGTSSVEQSMAIQEPAHIGENDDGLEVFSMNFVFKVRYHA